MKLVIGPANLQTDFEFEIFKKVGNFTTVEGRIGHINKIGVYVSGGLDSTALLCLILTELRRIGRMDMPIICFTVAKGDMSVFHAVNVIRKVEAHFGVSLRHINEIPNDTISNSLGNIGYSPIKFVHEYSPNMVTYMGINRMAPDEIRPFTQNLNIDYGWASTGKVFSAPFLFLHKPQILDIIYQLGCEDLIPYTRSCNVQSDDPCGKCYSCQERKWGFDALGKHDVAV